MDRRQWQCPNCGVKMILKLDAELRLIKAGKIDVPNTACAYRS